MIGRLRGHLLEIGDEEVIVECGGVGYVVRCGVRTLAALPSLDSEVILYIESATREDGTRLYGFLTKDERKAYVVLQGVQGVGPKAALSVLDILTPHELAQAVAHEDKASVGRANGVGPKLAQRIVIELKGKALSDAVFEVGVSAGAYKGPAPAAPSLTGESVAALIGLGIPEQSARLAVDTAVKALGPDAELPAMIRASLKALGR